MQMILELETHINVASSIGQGNRYYIRKTQQHDPPPKKPLPAIRHLVPKLIRNANTLFDLLFPWQRTFIFT